MFEKPIFGTGELREPHLFLSHQCGRHSPFQQANHIKTRRNKPFQLIAVQESQSLRVGLIPPRREQPPKKPQSQIFAPFENFCGQCFSQHRDARPRHAVAQNCGRFRQNAAFSTNKDITAPQPAATQNDWGWLVHQPKTKKNKVEQGSLRHFPIKNGRPREANENSILSVFGPLQLRVGRATRTEERNEISKMVVESAIEVHFGKLLPAF